MNLKEEKSLELIEKDNLIKILSAFYTYNHGDRACNPIEYVLKKGNEKEGWGNFKKLEQIINSCGYEVDEIKLENYKNKSKKSQMQFESRISEFSFIPQDIKKIILIDSNNDRIVLRETPNTLYFLANNGDERAKETFKRFDGSISLESIDAKIKRIKP